MREEIRDNSNMKDWEKDWQRVKRGELTWRKFYLRHCGYLPKYHVFYTLHKGRSKFPSKSDLNRWVKLYLLGYSVVEIADKVKWSRHAVAKWIREAIEERFGCEIPELWKHDRLKLIDVIRQLKKDGMEEEKIARTLSLSLNEIRFVVNSGAYLEFVLKEKEEERGKMRKKYRRKKDKQNPFVGG